MNFHPLFVHFPIAFWSIYSLMEMVQFKKIKGLPYWFYLKATALTLGTTASYVTYWSGTQIESMFYSQVVLVHSRVALTSLILYSILMIHYLLVWIEKDFYPFINKNAIWNKFFILNNNIFRDQTLVVLAFTGFILITLTGALGGIIAFGSETDPITSIVYKLLFNGEAY